MTLLEFPGPLLELLDVALVLPGERLKNELVFVVSLPTGRRQTTGQTPRRKVIPPGADHACPS